MFTDCEFMSAKEKELVLKQWRTFLKKLIEADFLEVTSCDYGQYPSSLDKPFTERLYKHLSLHCGFIAHYSRRGFLSSRFGNSATIQETIRQLEQGIPYPGFMDLNKAMVDSLSGLRNKLLSKG
jgi:hypothetical protein